MEQKKLANPACLITLVPFPCSLLSSFLSQKTACMGKSLGTWLAFSKWRLYPLDCKCSYVWQNDRKGRQHSLPRNSECMCTVTLWVTPSHLLPPLPPILLVQSPEVTPWSWSPMYIASYMPLALRDHNLVSQTFDRKPKERQTGSIASAWKGSLWILITRFTP